MMLVKDASTKESCHLVVIAVSQERDPTLLLFDVPVKLCVISFLKPDTVMAGFPAVSVTIYAYAFVQVYEWQM